MKKVALLLITAVLCASAAQAKILTFGVKAGLEMPSIETQNPVKGSTGFHAGVLAQFNLPIVGLGLQPEVLFARRGVDVLDGPTVRNKGVSYIDIPVNVTWGIDLKIVRPFLAVTPYVSYALTDVKTWVHNNDALAPKDVDNLNYGVGLGAGVELFKKLQVMGRHNFGLRNLVGDGSYKMRGFTVSVGYLF